MSKTTMSERFGYLLFSAILMVTALIPFTLVSRIGVELLEAFRLGVASKTVWLCVAGVGMLWFGGILVFMSLATMSAFLFGGEDFYDEPDEA